MTPIPHPQTKTMQTNKFSSRWEKTGSSRTLFFMIWVQILCVRKTFRLDMRNSKALALEIGFSMTTILTFKPLNLKDLSSPRDKSFWCCQMNYKKEITNEDNFIFIFFLDKITNSFFLLLMKTSLRIIHSNISIQGFAITTRWQFTRASRQSQLARSENNISHYFFFFPTSEKCPLGFHPDFVGQQV